MRIVLLGFLVCLGWAVDAEIKEGLCTNNTYSNCPKIRQRNGMCCRKGRQPFVYFKNSCLACQYGCDSYLQKNDASENCNEKGITKL